jgi:hypothetical protein
VVYFGFVLRNTPLERGLLPLFLKERRKEGRKEGRKEKNEGRRRREVRKEDR